MIEYYLQHPQWAVVIAALAVFTLWVCIMAGRASARHSKETNALMEKLKKQNKLRNEFSILTDELISSADAEDLFKGVGLNLQKRVADKDDMAAEFDSLNDSQKYIYSLYTFFEDAENKLSDFFRANTKPLTSTAKEAVNVIVKGEFAKDFNSAYNAFDEDNEGVSFAQSEIDEIDKETAPSISDGTVCRLGGEFIKANSSDFIK